MTGSRWTVSKKAPNEFCASFETIVFILITPLIEGNVVIIASLGINQNFYIIHLCVDNWNKRGATFYPSFI